MQKIEASLRCLSAEYINSIGAEQEIEWYISVVTDAMGAAQDLIQKGSEQLMALKKRRNALEGLETSVHVELRREVKWDKRVKYIVYKREVYEDGSVKSEIELFSVEGKKRHEAKKHFEKLRTENPEWQFCDERGHCV